MTNGDSSGFINYLRQTNPNFNQFMNNIKGKTPEQAFRDHGLDFNQYSNLL